MGMTREDAIEYLQYGEPYGTDYLDAIEVVVEALKAQEPRHGEWEWTHGGECSECGFHNSNFNYKFCQMCGAVMDRR